jgi:hypothetical protein
MNVFKLTDDPQPQVPVEYPACARYTCQRLGANWFNIQVSLWYCERCAAEMNRMWATDFRTQCCFRDNYCPGMQA